MEGHRSFYFGTGVKRTAYPPSDENSIHWIARVILLNLLSYFGTGKSSKDIPRQVSFANEYTTRTNVSGFSVTRKHATPTPADNSSSNAASTSSCFWALNSPLMVTID